MVGGKGRDKGFPSLARSHGHDDASTSSGMKAGRKSGPCATERRGQKVRHSGEAEWVNGIWGRGHAIPFIGREGGAGAKGGVCTLTGRISAILNGREPISITSSGSLSPKVPLNPSLDGSSQVCGSMP